MAGGTARPRESNAARAATGGRPHDGADRSVETTVATIAKLLQRIGDLEAELQQRLLIESALRAALAAQERVLAQERIERAGIEHSRHLQNEYLSVLSHDLRTPLNAVLGWARMVSTDQTDLPTMRRAVEIIHRNASLQLHMLDDLATVPPATLGDASVSVSVSVSSMADHGPANTPVNPTAPGVRRYPPPLAESAERATARSRRSDLQQAAKADGGPPKLGEDGRAKAEAGRHDSRPATHVQTAAVESSIPDGAPSQQTRLKNARILVVDDDQDARDLLLHVLSEFGAAVETASSASEAVRAMSRRQFDILLSDIGMPDRDGYALIAAVRHDPRPHVRVLPTIAVTAYTGDGPRDEALSAGYDQFVTKPIDPSRFVQLVCNLLAGRDRD